MSALVVALTAAVVMGVLVLLVERGGRGDESAFDTAIRPRAEPVPEPPVSFTAARWLIVNATTTGGLHFRVRPVFVELTEAKLRDGHGLDLAHPSAPAVVGEPLWSIVRPDARAPDDRMAEGLSPTAMRAVLERLEQL